MRCPKCNSLVMPGDKLCPKGHNLETPQVYDQLAPDVESERKTMQRRVGGGMAPSATPDSPETAPVPEEPGRPELEFKGKFPGVVNLLLANAGFPFLPMGTVTNISRDGFQGGVLEVALKPEGFLGSIQERISGLKEGETVTLDPLHPAAWNYQSLRDLDESVAGVWEICLTRDGEILGKWTDSTTIHPLREWIAHPETANSLAGLVTPNDPAVKEFVSGLSINFTAYQSGSAKQVLAQVEALYEAIRRADFHYIEAPPSFEGTGQKVRFPYEILEQKQGTCLDWCVFMAALMQYVGLHPLIMLMPCHAFHGVWMRRSEPLEAPLRAEDIRDLAEAGEILVINSTNYFGPENSIDKAMDRALGYCKHEADLSAIDIHTCRAIGIKPVPLWR